MNSQPIETDFASWEPAPLRPVPLAALTLIAGLTVACAVATDPTTDADGGAPPVATEETDAIANVSAARAGFASSQRRMPPNDAACAASSPCSISHRPTER